MPALSPEEVKLIEMLTCDVTKMYPNIILQRGLKGVEYWLVTFPSVLHPRFTKEFVLEGLALVLENSCFQFEDKHYRLKTGTATGTMEAPTYANLVMAYL